jgi:hypothetical protein
MVLPKLASAAIYNDDELTLLPVALRVVLRSSTGSMTGSMYSSQPSNKKGKPY